MCSRRLQADSLTKLTSATGVPTLPNTLTLLDISGTTKFNAYAFTSGLVKLYAAGSGLTGTLPALPAALTYLDVSDTGITAFAGITAATGLKTLLAGGAPLTAVPSPLPAATLEYVYGWQPACACAVV